MWNKQVDICWLHVLLYIYFEKLHCFYYLLILNMKNNNLLILCLSHTIYCYVNLKKNNKIQV